MVLPHEKEDAEEESLKLDEETTENARVGYEVATDMWIYEGEIFWSKFNALLLANSILLGSIALASTTAIDLSSSAYTLFSSIVPIVGIILCLVWFQTTNRSFDFYKYWIYSARELEEQYLKNVIKTFSRGGDFAEGKEVKMKIGDEVTHFKIGRLGRFSSVKWAAHIITFLFLIVYLAFILLNSSVF